MFFYQQQIQNKRKKRRFLMAFLLILGFIVWQKDWVVYLYQQAKGGLDVAFNTRPLKEVLQDKSVPDSLKKRILYIQEVRKYAIDSLNLQDNPNVYQTLYDQQGKPLVHLLTVAERYKMEAKMFNFPIVGLFIGNFSYKGFLILLRQLKKKSIGSQKVMIPKWVKQRRIQHWDGCQNLFYQVCCIIQMANWRA